MGFWHSKLKNGDKAEGSYVRKPPNSTDNPEDAALSRIRKNLTHDLDTFLLNNILLSIQFFDNFERYVIYPAQYRVIHMNLYNHIREVSSTSI